MADCIEKLEHSCGSSDGLQVFKESSGVYHGYCFACSTFVKNPYGDKPDDYKPPTAKLKRPLEDIQRDVEDINTWGCHGLPDRKLKKEYLEYFGVKVGVSETDGTTPTTAAFPIYRGGEIVSYKLRDLQEKHMFSLGNASKPQLFGWEQAVATGAPRLIITEGEFDAVALFQVLKDLNTDPKYADFNPAVVSLSNGSGGAKRQILDQLSYIKQHFKDVVLAFDMDDAGNIAAAEVCKIYPEAMRANLPAKDANECLVKGHKKSLKNSVLFKAAAPSNSKLVYGDSLTESACKEAEMGLSFPWPALTALTRGERWGEVRYIGAGVKQGKSELLNALAVHKILVHGEKVFLVKPEEANNKTYKLLVGKAASRVFHDPNIKFDQKAWDEWEPRIGRNVAMLDLYQNASWETVKADIVQAAAEGYRTVYLDPITNFTNTLSASEANEKLGQIASEAASLAKDHKLSITIFCHLLSPGNGKKPHERGGDVLSNQFAGSRSMMRSCHYMMGLKGNRDPELTEDERNCRDLVILEDREFGSVGTVPLFWDKNTGQFSQRVEE